MKATVTDKHGFRLAIGGTDVQSFAYGDTLYGTVAERAIKAGVAKAVSPLKARKTKAAKPLENK